MAERIKLTPELLREQASTLTNDAVRNDDVIKSLDNVINGLVNGWEGPAQEAFRSSYNQKRATFDSFTDVMRKFSQEIINFADVMEGEEKRQRDKAINL